MEVGTYNTKQKKLILDFLEKNNNLQFTCEEIGDVLKTEGTPVGKTTVYRYLEKLTQAGVVRKFIDTKSKSATYQYIDEAMECNNHLHLKCLDCGDFIHLGCEFMHGVNDHIMEHHRFTVDNSKTVIYGLCEKCLPKGKQV